MRKIFDVDDGVREVIVDNSWDNIYRSESSTCLKIALEDSKNPKSSKAPNESKWNRKGWSEFGCDSSQIGAQGTLNRSATPCLPDKDLWLWSLKNKKHTISPGLWDLN